MGAKPPVGYEEVACLECSVGDQVDPATQDASKHFPHVSIDAGGNAGRSKQMVFGSVARRPTDLPIRPTPLNHSAASGT